jgi:hypothetical protein
MLSFILTRDFRGDREAIVGLPPNFLSRLFAFVNFMRLSSQKAAQVVVGESRVQEIRVAHLFGPRTPRRTWGTRTVLQIPPLQQAVQHGLAGLAVQIRTINLSYGHRPPERSQLTRGFSVLPLF